MHAGKRHRTVQVQSAAALRVLQQVNRSAVVAAYMTSSAALQEQESAIAQQAAARAAHAAAAKKERALALAGKRRADNISQSKKRNADKRARRELSLRADETIKANAVELSSAVASTSLRQPVAAVPLARPRSQAQQSHLSQNQTQLSQQSQARR